MSHLVTIKTQVRDPAALAAACARLGLAAPTEGTAELYSGKASGLLVNLPGWRYPVVVDVQAAQVRYDNFDGAWGSQTEYAGQVQPVCIPEDMRDKHAHIIGGTGTGKSTLEEGMFLQDISAGHGAAVLDPHGLLVQRLLCLIPPEHADRVVYFDPGDPKWCCSQIR